KPETPVSGGDEREEETIAKESGEDQRDILPCEIRYRRLGSADQEIGRQGEHGQGAAARERETLLFEEKSDREESSSPEESVGRPDKSHRRGGADQSGEDEPRQKEQHHHKSPACCHDARLRNGAD